MKSYFEVLKEGEQGRVQPGEMWAGQVYLGDSIDRQVEQQLQRIYGQGKIGRLEELKEVQCAWSE